MQRYVRKMKRFGVNKISEEALPKKKKGVIHDVPLQIIKPEDCVENELQIRIPGS